MKMSEKGTNIQVNGITMYYEDAGEGEVPVILIHGFPLDCSMWEPQMEFLSETHRVISYDIRGFGRSSAGKEKISMTLLADDLIKLMDTLGIRKAIGCGLSMGGYILLNAVSRYPNRFAAMVLSDTQCIADSREAREKRQRQVEQIYKEGLDGFADSFVESSFSKRSVQVVPRIVEKVKNKILQTSQRAITETLTAIGQRHEMCSWLRNINMPAMVLCGNEDVVTPVVQSEFLNSRMLHSELHFIDQAGHLSNLEQPTKFNEYLSEFLFRFGGPLVLKQGSLRFQEK